MKLTCITQPATLAVSIEEAKSFCRILTNDDDALIELLINASTEYAQNVTGRQLCTATYQIVIGDNQSPLKLPNSPLKDIVSVKSKGQDIDYSLHYDIDVAFIEFDASDDVQIVFTAGYDEIPSLLKTWILNKVSTLYENRESVVVGATIAEMPKSIIDCALEQFKVRYL